MRTYHRWLSVLFGIFILWIAGTGLLSHAAALVRDSQGSAAVGPTATAQMAAAKAAGFVCPETMTCRVKPDPDSASSWVSYLHHLHAGEEFGLTGTILSISSGFALLFFAISGLYMYVVMFRRRARRASHPQRIFW